MRKRNVLLFIFIIIAIFAVAVIVKLSGNQNKDQKNNNNIAIEQEETIKETAEVFSDMVELDNPTQGNWVRNPVKLSGRARGIWYFEASFPVEFRDANGELIVQNHATAIGDWMTEEFVDFEATIDIPPSNTEMGELILKNDNPSGLPEYDKQVSVPIRYGSFYSEGECKTKEDCSLPFDYSLRSSCPFEADCYEGRCTVVCPIF